MTAFRAGDAVDGIRYSGPSDPITCVACGGLIAASLVAFRAATRGTRGRVVAGALRVEARCAPPCGRGSIVAILLATAGEVDL